MIRVLALLGVLAAATLTVATSAAERPDNELTLTTGLAEVVLGDEIPFEVRLRKKRGKPEEVNALRLARSSVSLRFAYGDREHVVTRLYETAPQTRLARGKPLVISLPVLAVRCGETTVTAVYRGLPEPMEAAPVKLKIVPKDDRDEIAAVVETSEGAMILSMWPDRAFNTVLNFLTLAREGRYDGLTFHRVISGFIVQGGDPKGDGTGGPGWSIPGEFEKDVRHEKGVISMARRHTQPDSAGCQFFLVHGGGRSLDGEYAAFGRVTKGLDVLDRLAAVETVRGSDGQLSRPAEPPVIQAVRVILE